MYFRIRGALFVPNTFLSYMYKTSYIYLQSAIYIYDVKPVQMYVFSYTRCTKVCNPI